MARKFDMTDVTLIELESALSIDPNALDEALVVHPEAFYRVAKKLALEISRRDASKKNLAEIEAEVDARIRHDAEVADEKVTEKSIESTKRTHPRVKKAIEELHKLNESVGLLSALKESFIQRGNALRELPQLHLSGYYGEVSVRATPAAREARERLGREGREAMNRARRSRSD